MTDNERLAKWQEWEEYHSDMNKHVPDYLNDDDAAMSLLDTLVEKGFVVELCSNDSTWACEIIGYVREYKPTRREAVCAAVLEMIERETLSGKEDV